MTTTHTAKISKATKVIAGLYQGTLTVADRTYTYEVQKGVVGETCDSGDAGWWRVVLDNDASDWCYATKAEALESLEGEYRIDPKWGLVLA